MVVDTSVLLAIYFEQSHCGWAIEQLEKYQHTLMMSTVSLTEVLIHLEDRQPKKINFFKEQIFSSTLSFIAPSMNQATIAAAARLRFPLNLGDCFVYALAVERNCAILTLDRDFQKTDGTIILPT